MHFLTRTGGGVKRAMAGFASSFITRAVSARKLMPICGRGARW